MKGVISNKVRQSETLVADTAFKSEAIYKEKKKLNKEIWGHGYALRIFIYMVIVALSCIDQVVDCWTVELSEYLKSGLRTIIVAS